MPTLAESIRSAIVVRNTHSHAHINWNYYITAIVSLAAFSNHRCAMKYDRVRMCGIDWRFRQRLDAGVGINPGACNEMVIESIMERFLIDSTTNRWCYRSWIRSPNTIGTFAFGPDPSNCPKTIANSRYQWRFVWIPYTCMPNERHSIEIQAP